MFTEVKEKERVGIIKLSHSVMSLQTFGSVGLLAPSLLCR